MFKNDTKQNMQLVLKNNMRKKVLDVRKKDEYVDSLLRITAYKEHNKLILDEFRHRIQILDENYNSYKFWNDVAQISIIFFSTISSFVTTIYELEELDPYEIFALVVTCYTTFILALMKYKKIEERKEDLNNIRHQCADFLTSIQTRNDKLNTWCCDKMWAGGDIKEISDEWKEEDKKLHEELMPLIEKKQELTCEFEKIIDTKTVKKLLKIIRERNIKDKVHLIKITRKEDELDNEATEIEARKKQLANDLFYQDDSSSDVTVPDRPMISMRGGNRNKVIDESAVTSNFVVNEPHNQ
uniref:Uncharacterized protein n=1 Tax=viral metagenome TaxID=1070528 RepID=A0A6C0CPW4_9ZZZZ